jgi:hypothetical protein
MLGKTARGASSPAKPALHIPEPLSTTKAAISSICVCLRLRLVRKEWNKKKAGGIKLIKTWLETRPIKL